MRTEPKISYKDQISVGEGTASVSESLSPVSTPNHIVPPMLILSPSGGQLLYDRSGGGQQRMTPRLPMQGTMAEVLL